MAGGSGGASGGASTGKGRGGSSSGEARADGVSAACTPEDPDSLALRLAIAPPGMLHYSPLAGGAAWRDALRIAAVGVSSRAAWAPSPPDPDCDAVHTGSVHTVSVHTGSVHTGSVHIGSVHTGSVHNGSVHTGSVHTGWLLSHQPGGGPPSLPPGSAVVRSRLGLRNTVGEGAAVEHCWLGDSVRVGPGCLPSGVTAAPGGQLPPWRRRVPGGAHTGRGGARAGPAGPAAAAASGHSRWRHCEWSRCEWRRCGWSLCE